MPNQESSPDATVIRGIGDRPDDELAKALDQFPGDNHLDPDAGIVPSPPTAPLASWRVAGCLLKLRAQINGKFPGRDKSSDGTIGDENHCPGSSDHCPSISDGGVGVVTAMDITHDPDHGLDAGAVAETLRVS